MQIKFRPTGLNLSLWLILNFKLILFFCSTQFKLIARIFKLISDLQANILISASIISK